MNFLLRLRLAGLCVLGVGLASCGGAGSSGSPTLPALGPANGSAVARNILGASSARTNATVMCTSNSLGTVPVFVQMQKNSAIGSSVTVTLNCTPNVGDLLLAYVNDYGTTPPALNTPPGWSAVESSTYHILSTRQGQMYSHIVGSSDPATYTFSAAGSTYLSVILGDYAGTDQIAPIEKHGIFEHGLAGAHNTVTLVPGLPNELPVSFFVSSTNASGATSTSKSGWTGDLSFGGPTWLMAAQHGTTNGTDTTSGVSGTNTWSGTAGADYDYLALLAPCVSPCVIPTPTPAATPSPTPMPTAIPTLGPPILQQHVLTGEYLGGSNGTHTYSWSTYAPWVTLAETNPRDSNGISAVGIKTMAYTNPPRINQHDPMYTTDETAYAHTCSGARLTDANTLMLTDPASTVVRSLWQSTTASLMSWGHFDYIFMDDANDIYGYKGATPCNYNPNQWLADTHSLIGAMPFAVVYNALAILGPNYGVSTSVALNDVSAGGMKESCYLQTSGKSIAKLWRTSENTELVMATQRKMFLCYTNQTTDSASAHDSRMFAYASFLLTYDPQSSLLWERFTSPSGFRVQPETQIVATMPLISTPSDISGLLTTTGVYGREYAACYVGGSPVGPCAAVVNASDSLSHSFPYTTYHHSLMLNGGSALDGGSIDTNGQPPSATLPPMGSAIVFN